MNRIKVPILMYHEISKDSNVNDSGMSPINISVKMFESQIKLLAEKQYRSIFFNDIQNLNSHEKYVIITFDDGWQGNYKYALPILKKYGFNAIFFITVGHIDSKRFMTWNDLMVLKNNGMDIQSHTMSHTPLQTIKNLDKIRYELKSSKDIIEGKLGTQVTAMSFPHGSYNQIIIGVTAQVGYEVMCTSDIQCVFNTSFIKKPVVLGRIPITNSLNVDKFIKYIEYDNAEILKLKLNKLIKKYIKNIVGINFYRFFYRKYFRININQ